MRKILTMLTATAVPVFLVWSGTAAATPHTLESRGSLSVAEQESLVSQFVQRAHDNWKLDINASDYQVLLDGKDILIVPQDTKTPRRVESRGYEMFELDATVQRPSGDVRAEADNPRWNQPKCFTRINLYNRLDPTVVEAWADACYQTGSITYANQQGWDAVLKQWQTCATTGRGFSYKLTGCNMAFAPASSGGGINFLSWNDWDPKSTLYQNPCANINLGIAVAGIGAQLGLNLCETLNPVKGAEPLDFQSNWSGYAATGHSRQTGDIISVNNFLGGDINFRVLYGGISATL